jgi:hypothetical protein
MGWATALKWSFWRHLPGAELSKVQAGGDSPLREAAFGLFGIPVRAERDYLSFI